MEQNLQSSEEFECQSQMSLFRILAWTIQETDVRKVLDWDGECVNLTHHINQGKTVRYGYLQDSRSI
ncbi:MAG: hypothetical protein ACOVLE_01240 [Pirellula staleyi]